MATDEDTARCQRGDARENRERILTAAGHAFAEDGLSVSLIEIARRAGVGNATLHRNFTKEQLLDELYADWFARRQAVAEQALADPDPWHGLASFLEDVVTDGTRNRAVGPLFAIRSEWRDRFRCLIKALLTRAQDSGAARRDLAPEDITLCLLGVARTMAITGESSPDQWRRHLTILLDGMKSQHPDRLPGLALSPDQLDLDLCQWSSQVLRNSST
ncbi:MAG: TetR/AcrR family transcriptional regulator [Jatrophihabitantaceae bacterium]